MICQHRTAICTTPQAFTFACKATVHDIVGTFKPGRPSLQRGRAGGAKDAPLKCCRLLGRRRGLIFLHDDRFDGDSTDLLPSLQGRSAPQLDLFRAVDVQKDPRHRKLQLVFDKVPEALEAQRLLGIRQVDLAHPANDLRSVTAPDHQPPKRAAAHAALCLGGRHGTVATASAASGPEAVEAVAPAPPAGDASADARHRPNVWPEVHERLALLLRDLQQLADVSAAGQEGTAGLGDEPMLAQNTSGEVHLTSIVRQRSSGNGIAGLRPFVGAMLR
mmetsp:Transcript_5975/g.17274  ORF Transcript_5975/g.17274 Transcript_5975/m.17274 type:complete len:275 (-) Transcript_5975:3111-3935(-)